MTFLVSAKKGLKSISLKKVFQVAWLKRFLKLRAINTNAAIEVSVESGDTFHPLTGGCSDVKLIITTHIKVMSHFS